MAVYDKISSEKEFEDSLIGQGEVLYFPSISDNKPQFIFKTSEQKYYTIKNGVTFTPYINDNGDLSWTNDGGLENTQSVNLKPIAGKDFFTEEDKSNIVNEVIEKLPIYVLNEKTH